jgi:hypothetical protein
VLRLNLLDLSGSRERERIDTLALAETNKAALMIVGDWGRGTSPRRI